MTEPAAPDAPTAEPPTPRSKPPRWRRALVAVLVVLGCVLAPLSVVSVWLKTTLINTNGYVSTMGPLAEDPAVQEAVANRVTNLLVANVPVEQEIADRLPPRAQFLAPKISDALTAFVRQQTLRLVESDRFASLWENVNRRAHQRVVSLLEDKGSGNVRLSEGAITLDVGPILMDVNQRLEDRGIDVFADTANANADKQIVLFQSIWIKRAQKITDLLQKLAIVLPILTILCFGVAIVLSANRRRTVLRGAFGLALGTGLLLVGINGGRHFYLTALPSSVNADAAGAVYDQVIGGLRLALRTAFVFGVVVALAAWLTGPATVATRTRDGVLALVRGKGEAGRPASATAEFVARHRNGLRALVVAAGLVVLVAASSPTPAVVIVVAVLVLLGILLIEFLGRAARERG